MHHTKKHYNVGMDIRILPKNSVGGGLVVPGDKSISHRALILGALACGVTEVSGFLAGEDCLATARCLGQMGVEIEFTGEGVRVLGRGLHGLAAPGDVLYVGNSGTTIRLLAGLLAGQNFNAVLDGDASIRRRPMDRVVRPLAMMGAKIKGDFAPLHVEGARLRGINYQMPLNSAQVKSAILLAGLYARGRTVVRELGAGLTRDHTEIMIEHMRSAEGKLLGRGIVVPGDFSSAAFFIVAGLLLADEGGLLLEGVGVNPTRTGMLEALAAMGARIEVRRRRWANGEEIGDVFVRRSRLRGIVLEGGLVPRMIDEVPVFAVAAAFAEGVTVIRDAGELAVKESNRIDAMAAGLGKMGARVEQRVDGMSIQGGGVLRGAVVESYGDHRVAMALGVAALGACGETIIRDAGCVDVSFPGFFEVLNDIGFGRARL